MPHPIAIVDQSSGWQGPTGPQITAALWTQLRYHVEPAYELVAPHVTFFGRDATLIPDGAWPIYILDDPDVADALGYHDVDPQGHPYGRVFVKPTEAAGVTVSSVLSHEVVEAAVDAWTNLWADRGTGTSVAYEACDPVEASSYRLNGLGAVVEVSNFVTRAWFDPADKSGRYDFLRHLHAPLTLEKDGYVVLMRDGKVSQVFGSEYPEWRRRLKLTPQPSRTRWRAVAVDGAEWTRNTIVSPNRPGT